MFWNFYRMSVIFLKDVQKWDFGGWMEEER